MSNVLAKQFKIKAKLDKDPFDDSDSEDANDNTPQKKILSQEISLLENNPMIKFRQRQRELLPINTGDIFSASMQQ